MHQNEISGLMKALAPVIGDYFSKAIAPVLQRLKELESISPSAGTDGAPGKDGVDGAPGKDGVDGAPGKDGVDGVDGASGKDGADGKDGVDGAPGKDGVDGINGKDGVDGAPGKDGPTVDEVSRLVESLVSKAVAALPKQPISHMIDNDGSLVLIFSDGEVKNLGKVRGADGVSGKPGRDAVEISIASFVDEARSYPEGFCARWRGGLIRAERQTFPIVGDDIASAGWATILEGVASESEELLEDGRFLERRTVYTSGKVWVRKQKLATPIDRGPWKEVTYDRGDSVSLAGSLFIAQRDTLEKEKPEQSDAWRLAVKRGRNGADGKLKDVTPKQVKI